ncbi:MAG: SDR family oxidoreductase [Dehalococcoidia bacterium]|nr:SDR family oxidoreductase [Dehalococcoidia bacterium]
MSQLEKMSLEGKVAIVIVEGRGMGREICLHMARAGADVVAAARSVSEIEAVAQEVRAIGRRALAIRTDVTVPQQIKAMVDQTIAELGHVDILVSLGNANARGSEKPIWDNDLEKDFAPNLKWDLLNHFYCAQAVLKHMVERHTGKIIFDGTAAWWNKGGRHLYVHTMSEGGIVGMARALAIEHARDNIQVNVLGTGVFETGEAGGRYEGGRGEYRAQFIPAKRFGKATEEGPLAVFLASDASNYITGQILYLDGGVQPSGLAPINYFPTIPLMRH